MLVIFFLNHVHQKRSLTSELLAKLPSRSCSVPRVIAIPVLLTPNMAQLTLKELMSLKIKKTPLIDYSQKSLEDMHEVVLMAGTKHKGKEFQEIFKDDGYNQRVAPRVTEDPQSQQGVELYAYYLRRRLEAEIPQDIQQEKKETRKGKDRPLPVSKPMKDSIAALGSSPPDQKVETMDDTESQWTQVSHLEENMASMGERMLSLEHTLGQIMGYLQQTEQARMGAQAEADRQGQ